MDGLSKVLASIPPQNRIYRTERPTGNEPYKEPPQIKIEDIPGAIQLQKNIVSFNSSTVHGMDGTISTTMELSHEAYKLLYEAGYIDGEVTFDLGKKPAKYLNGSELPKFEYDWDSAEGLLNSIFDSMYRNTPDSENRYKKIVLNLYAPAPKPPAQEPVAPPPVDEGRMKVGDKIYPGKKNYGPVEEPAYDVKLTSRAGVPNVEWSMEGVEVELKTDELRFDEDFEVIKTGDIFAEMEARDEEFQKQKVLFELGCSYMGNAFQKWIRDFELATKYAATDRAKFEELAEVAQKEYDEAMKPFYELNKKFAEDGDYEAYINSSLFDPYRKSVMEKNAKEAEGIPAKQQA